MIIAMQRLKYSLRSRSPFLLDINEQVTKHLGQTLFFPCNSSNMSRDDYLCSMICDLISAQQADLLGMDLLSWTPPNVSPHVD